MPDFIRVAAVVPSVSVSNIKYNTDEIIKQLNEIKAQKPNIVAFPELCITGYTCGDLFFQKSLQNGVIGALNKILIHSNDCDFVIVVGAPLEVHNRLYNCAVVIYKGKIKGIVPKTFIPNYNEFYEKRWFCSGRNATGDGLVSADFGFVGESYNIPFTSECELFYVGNCCFGIEVCEDLWSPLSPGRMLCLSGAEVVINISASNETIAKRKYRRDLCVNMSGSCVCGYVYTSAGAEESTTDLIFSGHSLVCENGSLIAENKNYIDSDYTLVTDIDLGKIRADRAKITTFSDAVEYYGEDAFYNAEQIEVSDGYQCDGSLYNVNKLPFVPSTKADRLERCMNIFEMQVAGLKKRLCVTGSKPVIGVSGGLDSTLALLVCYKAVKELDMDVSDVHAITMPCFGTTDRTYNNALELMKKLGVTIKEINIKEACKKHCEDIDYDLNNFGVTFENVQARERTQVLMDYACKIGGFVVGTGDLSELALGWCTYNADHMSMYGVNASVPKTLVRWMIDAISDNDVFAGCKNVLADIIDTPISPELLPPDEKGEIKQETESIIGPYALHDFFLYNMVRFGFSPTKIFCLANKAFAKDFDKQTILKWEKVFYKRFFTQQFKRSCLPDGVKVGSICLSPRGDWRMPSDACGALWLDELEKIKI